MSHRAVAGVATHCSPSMRPLAGHPHAVWLTHAHPATVHCMPALPLSSRTSPSAHCASPLAGGSAGAIHAAWLARAAHAGKMPTRHVSCDGDVAGVTTYCLPLHAAPVWAPACSLAHARSPSDSTLHACAAPFLPNLPIRTLCLPARRRLSRCDPRGLAGARGTCGQNANSPRRVLRDGACGRGRSASVHVVRAV